MEDVLDVYARPYNPRRPQVCLDEGGKELRDTPNGTLPMQPATEENPGQPVRQDYEYERNGKANLFLWIEPLVGQRGVLVTKRHTACDYAEVLKHLVDEVYPDAEKIVLVTDNLNIANKIEWHYTPVHGSWLNIAEIELSVLARQCLCRRIADIEALCCEVAAWERARNARAVHIDWQFTTADARIKLKRLYPVLKEQKTDPNEVST
jgi:hypothetical protein